jgi:transposase-like protein
MSARTIFCRFCGAAGAHKYGKDRQRRQRYKCPHCTKVFLRRTKTVKSGSHLSDQTWQLALRLFATRAGMSAQDLSRVLRMNRKTAQRLNRIFRLLAGGLAPRSIPGCSEWDESLFTKQWVLGGVSRDTKQCLLRCVPDRREDTLCPLVLSAAGPEGLVFTDEHGGYNGLYRRMTVCHEREFVNNQARFVHTNTQEGIWGHAKTLSWHVYRGFPRQSLPGFLSECMFRYNIRQYHLRVSVLSALLTRKTNSYLV